MVKTSELTGSLTDVLDDMANYYKTSETNRKEIIGALTYPSVIFVFAIAILTFIILWVVPQFTSMYSQLGSELPWITKLLISFSDFLSKYIFLIILAIALIIIILVVMYKNITSFRYFVQKTLMHIPVVSKIIKYNELIMFTKTFASLINHDVFITDSMEILGKITNNEIYKLLIRDAVNNLSTGNGVSVAFKDHWAFPQTAY
jgi:type IV pilus assembly protein PilC